jgi:probable phosphoglycerate mutase
MNAIFMRHGRTNYNDLGLCNDDPRDAVSLSPLGEQQARDAARKLEGKTIDRIYVSELPRTRQTAQIVNARRGAPIVTHPALNDIRSGFNGRPVRDYQAAIAHDPLNARVNGGETLLDHKRRVLGFLDELRRGADDSVLVVAHEETLRVLYAAVHPMTDEEMIKLAFRNCEYFETTLGRQTVDEETPWRRPMPGRGTP